MSRKSGWKLNEKDLCVELYIGGRFVYDVDLEKMTSPEKLLDMIFQIHEKTWATPSIVRGLLVSLTETINPQETLCPWGKRKTIEDVKTLLSQRTRSRRNFSGMHLATDRCLTNPGGLRS